MDIGFYEILWKRACEIQDAEFMAGNEKGFKMASINIAVYEAMMCGDSLSREALLVNL